VRRVLILDPDPLHRDSLQVALAQLDPPCAAVATGDVDVALRELAATEYDCVICDRSALARVMSVVEGLAVVSIGEALDAYDWVSKPVHPNSLAQVLRRVHERAELLQENRSLRDRLAPAARPDDLDRPVGGMVGDSAVMQRVYVEVRKVAQYKTNVLIMGGSGTGKELVARALHDLSPRARAPFVAINCGAIPASLLESELFGHRRGAFTDAVRDKRGMFQEADGGTLFLDEIGELPLELQVKLLRALQEGEIRAIGDEHPTSVDVRVVAATVRDLDAAVRAGLFREDLYYRVNVVPLELPALHRRREDIPALVEHFIAVYGRKHGPAGLEVEGLTPEALAQLMAYDWPGNIRELENTIERAMVLCEGVQITEELLEDKFRRSSRPVAAEVADGELSIKKASRVLERQLIERALEQTGGNRTNTAKLLEISHRALLYKIKEYGL